MSGCLLCLFGSARFDCECVVLRATWQLREVRQVAVLHLVAIYTRWVSLFHYMTWLLRCFDGRLLDAVESNDHVEVLLFWSLGYFHLFLQCLRHAFWECPFWRLTDEPVQIQNTALVCARKRNRRCHLIQVRRLVVQPVQDQLLLPERAVSWKLYRFFVKSNCAGLLILLFVLLLAACLSLLQLWLLSDNFVLQWFSIKTKCVLYFYGLSCLVGFRNTPCTFSVTFHCSLTIAYLILLLWRLSIHRLRRLAFMQNF